MRGRFPSKRSWMFALACWLALRLIASAAAAFSLAVLDSGPHIRPPGFAPPDLSAIGDVLAGVWLRADAMWYLRVSESGYGSDLSGFAFFPAFPLLARVFSLGAESHLVAGLIVASAATIAGLAFFHAWVEVLHGGEPARVATAAFALFPTSFFLVAPYGEPVLFAFGAAALYFAHTNSWIPAGAAGLVAGISRPFGALLTLPLLFAAWSDRARGSTKWAVGLLPVAGAAAWLAFAGTRTGHLLAGFRVQSLWQRELAFPGRTVIAAIRETGRWSGTDLLPWFLLDLVALAAAFGLIAFHQIVLQRSGVNLRVRWGLGAYELAILLLCLASPFPPRPLLSLPRFLLGMFPAFAAFGLIKGRWTRRVVLIGSAGGLAALTAAFVAGRPIF